MRPVLPLLAACLLALSGPVAGQASTAERAKAKPTQRWYEKYENKQKVGYIKVTWAPSTWKGKKTLHDATSMVFRSVRNMAGYKTVFETTITLDLERGQDGTLWSQKVVVAEASRVTTEELTWTGKGYSLVVRIGKDKEQRKTFPMPKPVHTDAESFLSAKIQAGTLKVGDTFRYRILDQRARQARLQTLEVVAKETIPGEQGKVACFKVKDRDPQSGATTYLWLDDQGAFVQLKTDRGSRFQRVTQKKAEGMPTRPAEFSVTTPSTPPLPRVFSATRMRVDVHLQGDKDRPLPKFPTSPWSKVVKTSGSDAKGWVVQVELRSYDDATHSATLPVDATKFKQELEPTPLMPSKHPDLVKKAQAVIGGEKNIRKAAYKLARYVHTSLRKESPDVASTTALEILREGRGDCSEHCVLFVALCRAAGIPARRATGFVNIGTFWGAHAWAEIWIGGWVGADPTTGEVGTAARYIFFGYPDRAGSFPGLVSSRAAGRMRLVSTRIEEGTKGYDLTNPATLRRHDKATGSYLHVLSGIELRGVPQTWQVSLSGSGRALIVGPTLRATLRVRGDQGDFLENLFGRANASYAGAKAYRWGSGKVQSYYIHDRRRLIDLRIMGGSKEDLATLAKILAPTFSARPAPKKTAAPTSKPAK